jgi:hypothetical protein
MAPPPAFAEFVHHAADAARGDRDLFRGRLRADPAGDPTNGKWVTYSGLAPGYAGLWQINVRDIIGPR